jgi:hypothetical protein
MPNIAGVAGGYETRKNTLKKKMPTAVAPFEAVVVLQ